MATKLDNFDSPSSKELMARNTLVAVPTVAADLSTTDTYIYGVVVSNTTAGALTITIKDKTGSLQLFPAKSIAANDVQYFNFPVGIPMLGGVNWIASGVGLVGYVAGFVKG